MIRTGIITAPRPRPSLAESVRSYRAAGFDNEVLVFSDNGDVVADGVRTLRNEVRLGNKLNWMRALSVLTTSAAMDDWIMVCEDDISWAVNARRDLEEALEELRSRKGAMDKAGVLSLYTPKRVSYLLRSQTQGRIAPGWYSTGLQMGRKTWGAQCYLFTWQMAVRLLNNEEFKSIMLDTSRDKNIDAFVGQCLNNAGLDVVYRIPCLVIHDLGTANSSLGYRDDRPMLDTECFRGPRA